MHEPQVRSHDGMNSVPAVNAPSDAGPAIGSKPEQSAGPDPGPVLSSASATAVPSASLRFQRRLELTDELAKVFARQEEAAVVLVRAGFRSEWVPWSGNALVFWSQVADRAESGQLEGGLLPIIDAAAKLRPYNHVFRTQCSPTTAHFIGRSNQGHGSDPEPAITTAPGERADVGDLEAVTDTEWIEPGATDTTGGMGPGQAAASAQNPVRAANQRRRMITLTLSLVGTLGLGGLISTRVGTSRDEHEVEDEPDPRSTSIAVAITDSGDETITTGDDGPVTLNPSSTQGSTTSGSLTAEGDDPQPVKRLPTPVPRKIKGVCVGIYDPGRSRLKRSSCSSLDPDLFVGLVTHHAESAEEWEFFLDVNGNQILTVRRSSNDEEPTSSKLVEVGGLECWLTITKMRQEWEIRLHYCTG